jgi:hypothetical protein
MPNKKIKDLMKEKGITQWKVADKMGVCEMTIIRLLRRELTPEKEQEVINAINEVQND